MGRIMIRVKFFRLILTILLVALVLVVLHLVLHTKEESTIKYLDNPRSLDGPGLHDELGDEKTFDDALEDIDVKIGIKDLIDTVDTGAGDKDSDLEDLDALGGLSPLRAFPPPEQEESPRIQLMKKELSVLNGPDTSQSDPRLIQLIKDYWLLPPSNDPYALDEDWKQDFSMGQSQLVDELLQGMEGGFFVEVGALDGETRSNTLFFERERKWTGLLIEAGPKNYRQLVSKHRKAFTSPACVNVKPYPSVMQFNRGKNRGRLIDGPAAKDWVLGQRLPVLLMEVQCFPIYSLLLALNQTRVHYLSLDVEGVELDVLRTVPFDRLDIQVMTVEFTHDAEGKDALRTFVESQGYTTVTEVTRDDRLANDFVFLKKLPT